MSIDNEIAKLFERQLVEWQQAADNYRALERVISKEAVLDGFPFKVQFNPARIISSAAKVDAKSIQERRCFLCKDNRPLVQEGVEYIYQDDIDNPYTILINPFPISPRHLTIPLMVHSDQLIAGRLPVMLDLACKLDGYTLFYNGPKCGASAPDHFHFQAANRGFLPLEANLHLVDREYIYSKNSSTLSFAKRVFNGLFVIEADTNDIAEMLFNTVYGALPVKEGEKEPMINILCRYEEGKWTLYIFVRAKHRPSCYFEEGESNILISPASVDLGGVFITPLEKDFNKITSKDIGNILGEVCISFEETTALANEIIKKLKP